MHNTNALPTCTVAHCQLPCVLLHPLLKKVVYRTVLYSFFLVLFCISCTCDFVYPNCKNDFVNSTLTGPKLNWQK